MTIMRKNPSTFLTLNQIMIKFQEKFKAMNMKILGFAAIGLLLVSCAKDYNCECTYTNVDDPTDT